MSFKEFISELFSFNLFLTVDLKDYIMTINEIVDQNERFFDAKTLLSLYSHRLKPNNILSFRILRIILCLFIYDFSRIKP